MVGFAPRRGPVLPRRYALLCGGTPISCPDAAAVVDSEREPLVAVEESAGHAVVDDLGV